MNIIQKFKQSNFDKAIDLLIKENKKHRNRFMKESKKISGILYLNSFCTVHCSAGRGIGKTNYIGNHATDKDIIILQDRAHVFYFTKQFNGHRFFNVYSIDQVPNILKGRRFQDIYIDEPQLCFKNYDKFKFYQDISFDGKDHTIIMLGE